MNPLHPLYPASRTALAVAALCAGVLAQAQDGVGLRVPGVDAVAPRLGEGSAVPADWSPWQTRLGLTLAETHPAAPAWGQGSAGAGLKLSGVQLLGDYYFSPSSGFRATGGVLRGTQAAPWVPGAGGGAGGLSVNLRQAGALLGDQSPTTSAYFGAGYSFSPGGWAPNWSFSADIGLSTSRPVKLGKVFSGSQGLDDFIQGLHLRPQFQVGVRYSF